MKQSMNKMSLGDRMKEYYENSYRIYLPIHMPLIIRLDGRAFHTLTAKMEKPFDKIFINLMTDTAKYLCENVQGAEFAYTQSDEISIFIHNYKNLESQPWFGNLLQKIVSLSAAMASSYATLQYLKVFNKERVIQFDSRAFIIPEYDLCNYFIWRQQDWGRNSIQMLAQSLYSHKDLYKKNKSDLQEMCFQKGHNWNDLSTSLKRGFCIIKKQNFENGDIRNIWIIDNEIPVFSKDRDYIEKLLKINL